MNKFLYTEEKKQNFSFKFLDEFYPAEFTLTSVLDFAFVQNLVCDSFSENENMAGNCAFGFMFRYIDEGNFHVLLVSDEGYFCIHEKKENELHEISPWKKIEGKKASKIKICIEGKNEFFRVKVGKSEICFSARSKSECGAKNSVLQSGNGNCKFAFCCQNYMIYEKVCCTFAYRLKAVSHLNEKVPSSAKCPSDSVLVVDAVAAPVACKLADPRPADALIGSESEFIDAWNFYDSARTAFLSGDIEKAKSDIFAASSELSENLAVLELYAFILRSENNVDHAIRLIKSNMKHAPYVFEYRKQAEKLLLRLQDYETDVQSLLEFDSENKALFPYQQPLVDGFLQQNL